MKKSIASIVFGMLSVVAFAQKDPQFTQNIQTRLAVNPAYSGVEGSMNFLALYRNQWAGFKGQPFKGLLCVDIPVEKLHGGVGLTCFKNTLGSIDNYNAKIQYAYYIKAGNNGAKLSLGTELGVFHTSVNGNWIAQDFAH